MMRPPLRRPAPPLRRELKPPDARRGLRRRPARSAAHAAVLCGRHAQSGEARRRAGRARAAAARRDDAAAAPQPCSAAPPRAQAADARRGSRRRPAGSAAHAAGFCGRHAQSGEARRRAGRARAAAARRHDAAAAPPHCSAAAPRAQAADASRAGSPAITRTSAQLFASDWPALPHSSPSSGASTIGRICAATQRLRCESAASARCGGREAAKAGATAAAGIERLVRRRCRGVRIWAHAPLAPSGAVSRSCTRSSVGFLSALRECDARAALVPPQSAVAG